MFARLCLAAMVLSAALVRADDVATQKVLERFDREWKVDSLIVNDNELAANVQNLTIRFKDGNMLLESVANGNTNTTKLPMTIDANFDPGLFDIKVDNDKRTLEGIYKFEGEQLKICVNANGQNRPTEITTAEGMNFVLVLSAKK